MWSPSKVTWQHNSLTFPIRKNSTFCTCLLWLLSWLPEPRVYIISWSNMLSRYHVSIIQSILQCGIQFAIVSRWFYKFETWVVLTWRRAISFVVINKILVIMQIQLFPTLIYIVVDSDMIGINSFNHSGIKINTTGNIEIAYSLIEIWWANFTMTLFIKLLVRRSSSSWCVFILSTLDLVAAILFCHGHFTLLVWVETTTKIFVSSSFGSFHPYLSKMIIWNVRFILIVNQILLQFDFSCPSWISSGIMRCGCICWKFSIWRALTIILLC